MIPKKITPYFKTNFQKNIDNDILITGTISCCNSHEFKVYVVGQIKYNIFSKMHLIPQNETTALEVRCKNCGKVISIFDSRFDGYDQCTKPKYECAPATKTVCCKKCLQNDFSVDIKYEYPNQKELEELEISASDNAFTWIWITLKCNKCKAKYKNFINLETA